MIELITPPPSGHLMCLTWNGWRYVKQVLLCSIRILRSVHTSPHMQRSQSLDWPEHKPVRDQHDEHDDDDDEEHESQPKHAHHHMHRQHSTRDEIELSKAEAAALQLHPPHLTRAPSIALSKSLRLNEDGEVDFRGAWMDTWHQRLLLIINFMFLMFGFAILLVAIYAMRTNPIDFLSDTPLYQAIAAIGLFIVVLSLLGCVGAYYEIKWLLILYAIILFLLLVAQLACGIYIYSLQSQATEYIQKAWAATPNALRVQVQNTYACCGLFSYNDTSAGQPCPSLIPATLAPTVAPTIVPGSGSLPTIAPSASTNGTISSAPCLNAFLSVAQSASSAIGTTAIVLASCQLAATVLVVWMLCRMRELRRKMEREAAVHLVTDAQH